MQRQNVTILFTVGGCKRGNRLAVIDLISECLLAGTDTEPFHCNTLNQNGKMPIFKCKRNN